MTRRIVGMIGLLLFGIGLVHVGAVTTATAIAQEPGPWITVNDDDIVGHDCLVNAEPCTSLYHDCKWRAGAGGFGEGETCYFCRMGEALVNRWCVRRANVNCTTTPDIGTAKTACGMLTRGECTWVAPQTGACGGPYVFLNEDTCWRFKCNGGGAQ